MATDDTPDGDRDGSVEGYDRDVERIDAEPWVDDVIVEPVDVDDATELRRRIGDRARRERWRRGEGRGGEIFHSQIARFDGPLLRDDLYEFVVARDVHEDRMQHESAEPRHLEVDAPTETRPRDNFPVHAQITLGPREPAAAQLRRFEIPEDGRKVTIDLTPSKNLSPHGPTTAEVLVFKGKDSDPVRFELEGTGEGQATLEVRAFADQQFLGAVHLDVTVHADARQGQQHARVTSMLTDVDPHQLTLEIRLDPERKWYEFQLRGAQFTEKPVRADAGALDACARGLQQQLNDLAKGVDDYSPGALQAILRGQGASIWKLLPPAVQEKLLDSVGVADRLCILTEGDPMPWELVYASAGDREPRGFLSDLFLVTRWQYGASPPLDIGRGTRRYVLPPGGPSAAASEIANVEKHIGNGLSLSRVDDVLAEIDHREFGLMHFAAHNVANFTRPNATAIQLDQPFIQAMVGDDRRGWLKERAPLVFVNACSSSTPTLLWAGAEGWAEKFLVAGAGGFVGTLWEIRDTSAAAFANEFYRHIGDNTSLGTAFREARKAIRAEGDPTWLAYTLYAHPYAHFHGVEP